MKNKYNIIDDVTASMFLKGEMKEDYDTYQIWPRMLDIVRTVAASRGLAYKSDCQALYERMHKCENWENGWNYLWYAATKKQHEEKRDAEDAEMIAKGYTPITRDNMDTLPKSGSVLLAWYSLNLGEPKKVRAIEDKGAPFFLAPKARRRGWSAWTLAIGDNRAYYKTA